jgi:apolipoprotein D and lipocalin family protein
VSGIAGRIAAAPLLIALMGCALQPAAVPARQSGAPIYSTAVLPIARMVGTWPQVAGIGATKGCPPAPSLQIAPSEGTARARYDLCLAGQRYAGAGKLSSSGAQGRYALPQLAAPIWVLWMDEGNRSMVLGTPDRSFAAVLSKDPIPSARLRAAREVLAWNGYDLAQFYQN